MTRAGLRLANQARREAGYSGLAAGTYIQALRKLGEDEHSAWRAEMAYRMARTAASKAREYLAYVEGRLHYPAAESA